MGVGTTTGVQSDFITGADIGLGTRFRAVELVEDRLTKSPASAAATEVVESLREQGVLTALIGRDRNALKFRPPLVFNIEHADIALEALDRPGVLDARGQIHERVSLTVRDDQPGDLVDGGAQLLQFSVEEG